MGPNLGDGLEDAFQLPCIVQSKVIAYTVQSTIDRLHLQTSHLDVTQCVTVLEKLSFGSHCVNSRRNFRDISVFVPWVNDWACQMEVSLVIYGL